jgi:hypothetical protein
MNVLEDIENLTELNDWVWQNMPTATVVVTLDGSVSIKTGLVEVLGGDLVTADLLDNMVWED